MDLQKMYPPQKDSPSTYLMGDITSDDIYIIVGSAEVLPQTVPFPLTLGYDKSVTETVMVTNIGVSNQLTVERGSQPLAWIAGTKCARVFTAEDLKALQTNIKTIAEKTIENSGFIEEAIDDISEHAAKIADNTEAIEAEVARSSEAISNEKIRAIAEEQRLNNAILAETERAVTKENFLQNGKINRTELTVLITDAQYAADGTTAAVTFTTYDANAQEIGQFVRYLPIISHDAMGLMTPEAYEELIQLREDVQALQQQGGKFIGVSFATKADLDAYIIPKTVNSGDFTYILDDETHSDATTRYIYNGTRFEFGYVIEFDPVGLATDATLGLVLSDSGSHGGKIFVEADGSMSVVGWTNILQDISKIETISESALETATEAKTFAEAIESEFNAHNHDGENSEKITFSNLKEIPVATALNLGLVRIGEGVDVDEDGRIKVKNDTSIPKGIITMWSGAATDIPSGWLLCDGQNSTPDLRNRFIVGAGNTYSSGDTGGADSVALTTAQMPSHNHTENSAGAHTHTAAANTTATATTDSQGNHSHTTPIGYKSGGAGIVCTQYTNDVDWTSNGGRTTAPTNSTGAHTHTVPTGNHTHNTDSQGNHTHTISYNGSGSVHENRPPYYALCFIMKT